MVESRDQHVSAAGRQQGGDLKLTVIHGWLRSSRPTLTVGDTVSKYMCVHKHVRVRLRVSVSTCVCVQACIRVSVGAGEAQRLKLVEHKDLSSNLTTHVTSE